jgi:hypothetical protein
MGELSSRYGGKSKVVPVLAMNAYEEVELDFGTRRRRVVSFHDPAALARVTIE